MARVRFSQPKPFRSCVLNCWHRLLKALSRSKSQGAAARTFALLGGQAQRPVVRDQQFGGAKSLQFGQQVFPALDLLHAEAAAGDVKHGQAEQALITEDSSQQVVAVLIEQGFVADGAGVMMRTT